MNKILYIFIVVLFSNSYLFSGTQTISNIANDGCHTFSIPRGSTNVTFTLSKTAGNSSWDFDMYYWGQISTCTTALGYICSPFLGSNATEVCGPYNDIPSSCGANVTLYVYVDKFDGNAASRAQLVCTYTDPVTGCSLGVESASITTPNACLNGLIPLGSGAYKDVSLSPNTFYSFIWSNSSDASTTGFCANVTGSTGATSTTFSTNQTSWFSGTTTPSVRVSASRSCWSSNSAVMTYRHVTPTVTLSSGAGTNNQTRCVNTAMTNITFATTNVVNSAPSSVTFSGLPPGVSGSWSANVATISGTPTSTGTFNYTVTASNNGCTATGTGTITVSASSVAPTSISGGGTYCHGVPITLSQVGGVLGSGASFEWFSGTCGGTSAGSGASITPTPSGGSTTYLVRVAANGGCPASACVSTTVTLPTAGTTLSTNGQNATCAVSGSNWIRFYETGSGNFIGAINPNNNLTSNVTMTSYVGSASSMDACTQPGNVLYRTAYMGRNWVITSSVVPTGAVSVLLPFTDGEMTGLTTAAGGTGSPTGGTLSSGNPNDNIDNAAGLRITKYSNPGSENGTPTDNCSAGSSIVINNSSSGNLTSAPHNYGIASAQYAIFPVSGFSEFYLHGVNNNSPLPVELISFSGTCTDKGTELTWQTASESNNDYFLVQRSRDGQNWEDLTTVSGNGNSTHLINYDWLDETGFGGMYYRLTQVDFNGDRYEKQAIFVNCESESTKLHVYPNPTQGDFTVEVNSTKEVESATISIIDVTGKALTHRNVEIHSGVNTFNFGDQLESGTYLIRVSIEGEIQTLRLVVKN